jgi:hypothetical protein
MLQTAIGAPAAERSSTVAAASMAVPRLPLGLYSAPAAALARNQIAAFSGTVPAALATTGGRAAGLGGFTAAPAAPAPPVAAAPPVALVPRGGGSGGEQTAMLTKLDEIRRAIERQELSVSVSGSSPSTPTSTSRVRSMPKVRDSGGM